MTPAAPVRFGHVRHAVDGTPPDRCDGGMAGSGALELDDRDHPVRPGLVLGEVRVVGRLGRVDPVALDTLEHGGPCIEPVGAELHPDRRVGHQVVEPVRVGRCPGLRGEDVQLVPLGPRHHRRDALEPGLRPLGGQEHDGRSLERAADLPAVRPEFGDDLGVEVVHVRHRLLLRPAGPRSSFTTEDRPTEGTGRRPWWARVVGGPRYPRNRATPWTTTSTTSPSRTATTTRTSTTGRAGGAVRAPSPVGPSRPVSRRHAATAGAGWRPPIARAPDAWTCAACAPPRRASDRPWRGSAGDARCHRPSVDAHPVSYTHLTLPTKRIV